MEKGVDFDDSFSPTPGLAVGRFMFSLAVANDYELHACDIEQAFLQADKLPEGVNGRYFIQPPPRSPDANNRDVVYEVCRPLYGNPSSPRALHKTLDAYCDPGEERRNKLTGWVDSDFATDPDTRKSMTGYLFCLNGRAVSWLSSRQGGVTLSSAEAEFEAASQAGQEAIYLRGLLRGFNFRQVGATEI